MGKIQVNVTLQMTIPNLNANHIERTATGVAKLAKKLLNGRVVKDPWDRQSGETTRAYEAFCLFRDMGVDRSVAVVEAEVDTAAKKWSWKWQWKLRAEAWDDHLQALAKKELETAKVEMAQRQARIGVKMQDMAEKSLQTVLPQSVGEVVKLAEVGSRIERMARGESTSNMATVHVFQWEGPLPAWAPKEVSASDGLTDTPRQAVQPTPKFLSAEIIEGDQ